MKTITLIIAAAAALTAQTQTTVYKRNVFSAQTIAASSAPLTNIGQAVHIMMVYFPTAVADVSGFTMRIEGSFDNSVYFPISEDVTTAVYNGTYGYAITRANGAYPYVRLRYVTAHASLPMTAHYTGAIQPIGIVRLSGTRYIADSPLSGATADGPGLTVGGTYFVDQRRMTGIVPANWTSVNLNASTTRTDGANFISLDVWPDGNWQGICTSLPASPYTVRIHWIPQIGSSGGDNPNETGFSLKNSAAVPMVWAFWWNNSSWIVRKQSLYTGSGVGDYQNNPYRPTERLRSYSIQDDGTYRYLWPVDNVGKYKAFTGNNERALNNDYITPNQICAGAKADNGNYRTRFTLVGYDINPTW